MKKENSAVNTEKETLTKLLKLKVNQVMELLNQLNHTKEGFMQLTIGSTHLSEVLSHRRTSSIKEDLDYNGKGEEIESN